MTRSIRIPIYFLFFLLSFLPIVHAQHFTIMTEELKPFSYEEDGDIKGLCVDIVREMLKIVNHPDNIKVYPWNRAYQTIQEKANIIVFPMGMNPDRKNLFKWVGPIAHTDINFYKRKGSDIHIRTLEDAKKVSRISVREHNFDHVTLKSMGFTNLETTRNSVLNFKKLINDRADLIVSGKLHMSALARKAGVDITQLEDTGVNITKAALFLAFSKETDDKEIEKWQAAIDQFKKTRKYTYYMTKHLKRKSK